MLYVIAALALTWGLCMPLRFRERIRGNLGVSLVFKAIPTAFAAAFAGYALCFDPACDLYARLIFAGLCVCVVADVLLDIRFEVGGGLFFTGHVLYVLAMSQYAPLSWGGLAFFLILAVGMEAFLHYYHREIPTRFMMFGLRAYALALAALLGLALPLPFFQASGRAWMAALGAALFVVSDLTLCHNTIRKKPTSWHFVSLGIYYGGQLLLGLSALHIS